MDSHQLEGTLKFSDNMADWPRLGTVGSWEGEAPGYPPPPGVLQTRSWSAGLSTMSRTSPSPPVVSALWMEVGMLGKLLGNF